MPRVKKPESREVCSRCLQPVPLKAARCPGCGNRISSFRGLTIFVGIVGMIALVFVIVIMIQVVQNVDIESAPPETQMDDPILADPKPATSAEQEKPKEPEKPPPLNQ